MGNCLPKISNLEFSRRVPNPMYRNIMNVNMRGRSPDTSRWRVHIPIRRKRYSHKETQTTYSYPPSTAKEYFARNDSMNSSELWYSAISHSVNCEASATNSNNQTEYAIVSVPKRKEYAASAEEHNEYDYVLVT